MTAEPLIDVLLPVYNGEPFLRSSIESLLRQTHQNFRLIVVDDGSSDDTPATLKELAKSDARIVLHRQVNGGIVEALNAGLARCKAEYVARHDADDIASPERLSHQLAYLRTHPDVVAVGGAATHIGGEGEDLGTIARFPNPERADATALPALEPYLLHPFTMFRRDAMLGVGGYRHCLHAEDSDLYWRLQEVGRLVNEPTLIGQYRMHAHSISSRSIVNGRIMAVSSQRAARAAVRRRAGRVDLVFSAEAAQTLKVAAAVSLEAACRVGSTDLELEEVQRLRLAASMKLLELAGYRPFDLDLQDSTFIAETLDIGFSSADTAQRNKIIRSWSGSAARLEAKGLHAEARALLRSRIRAPYFVKSFLRRATPTSLYKALGDWRHGRKG